MNGQRKYGNEHNDIIFSHKEEWDYVCRKMGGTRDYYIK
jgi:hypothetical protein